MCDGGWERRRRGDARFVVDHHPIGGKKALRINDAEIPFLFLRCERIVTSVFRLRSLSFLRPRDSFVWSKIAT